MDQKIWFLHSHLHGCLHFLENILHLWSYAWRSTGCSLKKYFFCLAFEFVLDLMAIKCISQVFIENMAHTHFQKLFKPYFPYSYNYWLKGGFHNVAVILFAKLWFPELLLWDYDGEWNICYPCLFLAVLKKPAKLLFS